ncbi:MAG: hypothetical protein AAGC96_09140, partial [Pseudomonadota bacterium]
MAKRNAQSKAVSEDPLKALEDALRLDLEEDETPDLADELSLDDLEAQVASAAAELAKSDSEAEAKGATEDSPDTSDEEATEAKSGEDTSAPAAAANTSPRNRSTDETGRKSRSQQRAAKRSQKRQQSQQADTRSTSSPAFAPANDDSRDTRAAIMRSLDGSAGRTARTITYGISAVWVIGGLIFAYLVYGSTIAGIGSLSDLSNNPQILVMLLAILLPVMIILGFGMMVARAQEMRTVARSMAELSVRLFEPETMATDNIMRVGQAVRREVSAINEGIERTIARASELETLVHSEINALEHSYSDNEVRLRSLVDGLSNEREAIVSHSERVRASIVSAHEQLREELESAGDEISSRLTTSGKAVAGLLDTRTTKLEEQADELTQSVSDLLQKRTEALMLSFGNSGRALAAEFDNRLEALQTNLTEHGQNLLSE